MRQAFTRTEWQGFYKLKIWCHKPTGLRWQTLTKALYTCKQCGWQAKASETHLLVANHIKPHKGDWELFANPDNLECLCKPCHDSAVQSFERTGIVVGCDVDGKPRDAGHPWNR